MPDHDGGAPTRKSRSGMPAWVQAPARRWLQARATNENVTVGRGARIGRQVVLSAPHGLVIGDWVSIGPYTTIQADGTIGDFTLIGMGVQIAGREDHAIDQVGVPIASAEWVGDRQAGPRDAVTIGTDVWLGGRSTVLSGVVIGPGAVVGAGAVVTRDVAPFDIVGGNPARKIGERMPSQAARDDHLEALARLAERRRRL